jgi:anti-sigma B factor antagonist
MQTTDVPFHVDVRPLTGEQKGWALTLSGEIDSSTAPRLQQQTDDLIAASTEPVVMMLDLSRVEFVDSSGLRVIVSLGNALEDRQGHLELTGLSAAARRILELTGLIDRYRSGDDDDAAVIGSPEPDAT